MYDWWSSYTCYELTPTVTIFSYNLAQHITTRILASCVGDINIKNTGPMCNHHLSSSAECLMFWHKMCNHHLSSSAECLMFWHKMCNHHLSSSAECLMFWHKMCNHHLSSSAECLMFWHKMCNHHLSSSAECLMFWHKMCNHHLSSSAECLMFWHKVTGWRGLGYAWTSRWVLMSLMMYLCTGYDSVMMSYSLHGMRSANNKIPFTHIHYALTLGCNKIKTRKWNEVHINAMRLNVMFALLRYNGIREDDNIYMLLRCFASSWRLQLTPPENKDMDVKIPFQLYKKTS